MRKFFAILLVVGCAGVAAYDGYAGQWKTCALGALFTAANVLIFLV